ncbi:uncharacterized protein K489DRAFT_229754 [Dissoconium aciculare CBS 342.82]|uniref:Uncharacterized protein n=1 Tax=Dissoconium aciculare CBS 342.82 TaxID=1314786 RepID=A0A6J3M1T7_9PEZI|nr:uncharacterized protein K489DRAFT_229754 [Dissoconium aciculare CBS 342.82]KAF1821980.1 hypothetical protein K489DRAFT_229754 [Dissoconium aciculare CBS 342.82]
MAMLECQLSVGKSSQLKGQHLDSAYAPLLAAGTKREIAYVCLFGMIVKTFWMVVP